MYKYVYSFNGKDKPIYTCYLGSNKIGCITVISENKYTVNLSEFSTLKAAKNFLENSLTYRGK